MKVRACSIDSMTQRHPIQNGAIMLITTNTWNNVPLFEEPERARCAIATLYNTQSLYPFQLFAFVVMHNHCHVLLRADPPVTIAKIMNSWKGVTSYTLDIGRIWQARYHIRIIENPHIALHYIHMNPVVAGYCDTPESYPWSSASGMWTVDPLLIDPSVPTLGRA